jgi:ATP-dependent protease ClpP protease subunit
MTEQPEFTLHYFPFSIYSLMVRFGLTLGQKLNPETAPKVQVKLVDLQQDDNLSESYLSVNSKGQVTSSLYIHDNARPD